METVQQIIKQAEQQQAISLDLSFQELTTLPVEVSRLHLLQVLNIRGNSLSSLPADLKQLTQLKELNVGRNRLTAVPSVIFEMIHLESLLLYGNALTALPAEIGQLINLRGHAARFQRGDDLLRFAQRHARIVRAVNDQQRALLPGAHTCVGLA